VRVLTYDRAMARTPDGASVFYTPADAAGTPFFFERYFSIHIGRRIYSPNPHS
jgi:hypothetical protein